MVELLVVLAIVSTLMVVLHTSFGTGILAYKRMEENLVTGREADIFLIQFGQELRRSFAYFHKDAEHHFTGGENKLRFPAKLTRYTEKGAEDDLYLVEYEFKGRTLFRTEQKLKRKFKDRRKEQRETVFSNLNICRFEFLAVGESDELIWEREWTNEPYIGIPRGIRLTVRGDVFGREEQTFDILIPHGVLLGSQ